MEFDIGVLAFSYDPTGEYMQNITIVDLDQTFNKQEHVVDRNYLLEAIASGLKVMLVDKWRGLNLSEATKGPSYSPRRRILPLNVSGKVYLKASTDTSACDDMG
jgi:hypothetical protein